MVSPLYCLQRIHLQLISFLANSFCLRLTFVLPPRILIFGISTTNFALNDLPTEATIYLQCMALSFLIAVVPLITSKAIKIYVE